MKGITPVVAVILLLLITISMVGFAFVWFSRIGEITTQQTDSQLTDQLKKQSTKVRIEGIPSAKNTITIRNTGTVDIADGGIAVFVKGVKQTCDLDPLAAGATVSCTGGTFSCVAGDDVKVTSPGTGDQVLCPAATP